jgi:hypothetical protein
MTDKYKPLRDAFDQLKAEASTQGAVAIANDAVLAETGNEP